MALFDMIKKLFGGKPKADEGSEEPIIGGDEKHLFTITFKHSQQSVDFESTWNEVRGLSKRFGGRRGLKMNNFFVPWDEVAFIYCGDKAGDKDAKKDGGEGKDLSDAKPGDTVPATGAAKDLGADSMEVLGKDGCDCCGKKDEKPSEPEEPKKDDGTEKDNPDASKGDGALDTRGDEPAEPAKGETKEVEIDQVTAKVPTDVGVKAEEIK